MKLDKLGPFIVDIDTNGVNYFDKLDVEIGENLKEIYKDLNIDEGFEYTKLY